MSSGQNEKYDYDIEGDLFNLKLKSTIKALKEMTFEEFLKIFFEIDPCIPPSLAFGKDVLDIISVTGYALEKKDVEMFGLVEVLVAELEKKDHIVSKAFAGLIKKAIRLDEAGIPLVNISKTFEFTHLVIEFDKFEASLGKTCSEKSYDFSKYSNN